MTSTSTAALGLEPLDQKKADTDDLTLWSVTTIIGALDKPALLYWTGEEAAKAAITGERTWKGILANCDEDCAHTSASTCDAVKWLRDARFRRPRDRMSSAVLGTTVHALCEEYALTGARPDRARIDQEIGKRASTVSKKLIGNEAPVIERMLDAFDAWLQRFTPSYQATEVAVYSPTYGYAGTTDAFLTIDGVRSIVDYKTSRETYDAKGNLRTPYPEQVGLQLAAYRHAEFAAVWRPRRTEQFRRRYYLLSEEERAAAVPVPEVDGGLCLQISPEGCEAYPIRCDGEVHRAFLYTMEAFRWVQHTSKHAMGPALERGEG